MTDNLIVAHQSAERRAFVHYLRTGRRLPDAIVTRQIERKFNPYHDPRNGQFTFAPGGPRSLSKVIISDRRGHRQMVDVLSAIPPVEGRVPDNAPSGPGEIRTQNAIFRPGETSVVPRAAQYGPNPRVRIGNNGGPPLNDPLTLVRLFPGLTSSPGGSILAVADNLLDLTGPGVRLTTEMTEGHVSKLIAQIRSIEPNYRLDSLGFPSTTEGQLNLIARLRLDRAAALYRAKSEVRPLQVETLRQMQAAADQAYDEAVARYESGKLSMRLSRNEAIGNYIDQTVRFRIRDLYSGLNVTNHKNEIIRVNRRAYNTAGSERTYRVPDVRVGDIAFDVTLTRKTLATQQVQGFFAADFKPATVIIVRPRQLGKDSTYAITRSRKQQ